MQSKLASTLAAAEDHVMIIDVGPANGVTPRVQSLGKRRFEPIERVVVVV